MICSLNHDFYNLKLLENIIIFLHLYGAVKKVSFLQVYHLCTQYDNINNNLEHTKSTQSPNFSSIVFHRTQVEKNKFLDFQKYSPNTGVQQSFPSLCVIFFSIDEIIEYRCKCTFHVVQSQLLVSISPTFYEHLLRSKIPIAQKAMSRQSSFWCFPDLRA